MGLIWEKQWKWNEVAGKAANFAMAQRVRLQFSRGAMGRAPILAWHSGQGLRWANQATCTMPLSCG